jgi:hypothetical protein
VKTIAKIERAMQQSFARGYVTKPKSKEKSDITIDALIAASAVSSGAARCQKLRQRTARSLFLFEHVADLNNEEKKLPSILCNSLLKQKTKAQCCLQFCFFSFYEQLRHNPEQLNLPEVLNTEVLARRLERG